MNEEISVNLIVDCPHCKYPVLIEKLNCCIFRHGVLKHNGKQIDPHSTKDLCDYYVKKDLILGCGKPFQVIIKPNSTSDDEKYIAIICDYI
jgi:hypothetical protein